MGPFRLVPLFMRTFFLILARSFLFVSSTDADSSTIRPPYDRAPRLRLTKLRSKLGTLHHVRGLYGSDGDSAGQCGVGWVKAGAMCYLCSDDPETRDKAEKKCRTVDAVISSTLTFEAHSSSNPRPPTPTLPRPRQSSGPSMRS